MAAYVFNSNTAKIQKLEDKINDLPHSYVAKDDYRRDIYEVKDMLGKIFDKLDMKQDK